METDRRGLLKLLAGAACAGLPLPVLPAADARFIAARQRDGGHEAVLFDAQGRDLQVLALPQRGHSFAIDARHGRVVAFGRQPGFFATAYALDGRSAPQALPLPDGRHFYGHGTFSADGLSLYATENDYEAGHGVVGIYQPRQDGWRRVGEFPTHGIGPHELLLMPDGRTLCVANGGILTHPDYGKTELNLDSMQPSLVYLDAASGRLLEQVQLDPALQRLSIRHLAVDGQGAVWFACQYFGALSDHPPLLGRHRRGQRPELFAGDADTLRALRGYLGSLAVDPHTGVVAASSPVGGLVAWWDTESGRSLGGTPLADGCGIAADGTGRFLLSSGDGSLLCAAPGQAAEMRLPAGALGWDNHMRRVWSSVRGRPERAGDAHF